MITSTNMGKITSIITITDMSITIMTMTTNMSIIMTMTTNTVTITTTIISVRSDRSRL